MTVNKVTLLGRLGQDPEVRMTPNGQQVASMSLATSSKYKKDGQMQEETEWHRLVAWGKLAELAGKYLAKGKEVYVEGKLKTRSWEDQSGQKRYTTEIILNEIKFVGSKGNSGNSGNAQGGSSNQQQQQPSSGGRDEYGDYGSDVPF